MACETINPAIGEKIKTFDRLSDTGMKKTIGNADLAFSTWKQTSFSEQVALLKKSGRPPSPAQGSTGPDVVLSTSLYGPIPALSTAASGQAVMDGTIGTRNPRVCEFENGVCEIEQQHEQSSTSDQIRGVSSGN